MKIKKNIALSDSGFIFNPSNGDSYSVNPIGLEILQQLKEGKKEGDILAFILNNYRVEQDTVEKDLYDFKNMLENYKIIDNE